jgi:hypothetical protein
MVGLAALLLALSMSLPARAEGDEPPPSEPAPEAARELSRNSFRGDFKAGYALTEGAGMNDHILLEVTLGPQFGRAVAGGSVGVAPVFSGAVAIAEGGHVSLRLQAGLELALGVAKDLELVPILTGGFLKAFGDDGREGLVARVGLAFRVLGKNNFYLSFEPVSLVVLPAPPGGFTRYTSHVALDMGVVKVGGRGP